MRLQLTGICAPTLFFFKTGEMTILLEEVSVILSIKRDPGSSEPKDACTTLFLNSVDFNWILRGIVQNEEEVNSITKNGEVNLELLWKNYKRFIGS